MQVTVVLFLLFPIVQFAPFSPASSTLSFVPASSVLAKVSFTRFNSCLVSFGSSIVSFVCVLFLLWLYWRALQLRTRRVSRVTHFVMECFLSSPQTGLRPGWERHLSRLVRVRGTQTGFVRQVTSRQRSISPSQNPQNWAVQHSLFGPSCPQQNFRGVIPMVVMP